MGEMESRTRVGLARLACAAVALCALLVGTGCGADEETDTPPQLVADVSDPMDVTVEMRARGYHPETVRVRAGGKVTWVNTSAHKATAENSFFDDRRFDTHTIYRGQAKTLTMKRPGRYEYFSSYDSETFFGVLIVEPRGGRGDGDGS